MEFFSSTVNVSELLAHPWSFVLVVQQRRKTRVFIQVRSKYSTNKIRLSEATALNNSWEVEVSFSSPRLALPRKETGKADLKGRWEDASVYFIQLSTRRKKWATHLTSVILRYLIFSNEYLLFEFQNTTIASLNNVLCATFPIIVLVHLLP